MEKTGRTNTLAYYILQWLSKAPKSVIEKAMVED